MLIRDTDDERRARVEALICELLRPREQTASHLDSSRHIARGGKTTEHVDKASKESIANSSTR